MLWSEKKHTPGRLKNLLQLALSTNSNLKRAENQTILLQNYSVFSIVKLFL